MGHARGSCRMNLYTERLDLRRPTADDVATILVLHADRRATLHNPSDALTSLEEADELYRRWDEHWNRFGYGYWSVRRRKDDTPIGFCGVKRMNLREAEVLNLFCRLIPSAWGVGIGTEAATAVVRWANRNVPDLPVVARVRPDNHASHRVALRAGLARDERLDEPGEDGIDWIYVPASLQAPAGTTSQRTAL